MHTRTACHPGALRACERPKDDFPIPEGDSPIFAARKSGQSPSYYSVTPWSTLLVTSLLIVALSLGAVETVCGEVCHVWEKVEITLRAEKPYETPYQDVEVWVDLTGPQFRRRCYGFWDGGDTFRVRVLATAPGEWTWRSGSNRSDPGLSGKTGSFTAAAWSDAEKRQNPCRRGMIRPTANGHAFEYADGTPFFLIGDTGWSVPTFRYPWYDDDKPRPIGPAAGLRDYVR
ncbi:MAG: DUF5060 domain-containing protein, partial [Planctomycetota bacterium]